MGCRATWALGLLIGAAVLPAKAQRQPIYISESLTGLPSYSDVEPSDAGARLYLVLPGPAAAARRQPAGAAGPGRAVRPLAAAAKPPNRRSAAPRESIAGAVRDARAAFVRLALTTAADHGVPPALMLAVMHAESAFAPDVVSRAGAIGLMQIMPATGRRYGVERGLFDPATNARVGARYLRDLLVLFRGDLELAVAAYNAGESAVARYGNRVPPFAETRVYVPRVLALHGDYERELRLRLAAYRRPR